jgi:hypothetical protein
MSQDMTTEGRRVLQNWPAGMQLSLGQPRADIIECLPFQQGRNFLFQLPQLSPIRSFSAEQFSRSAVYTTSIGV